MSDLDQRMQSAQNDRRRSARFVVEVPATIRTVIGNRACHISNISDFGARLSTDNPPPAGIAACLILGGDEFFCTVKWSEGDSCGIEFDQPIADDTLNMVAEPEDHDPSPVADVGNIQAGRRRNGLVSGGE